MCVCVCVCACACVEGRILKNFQCTVFVCVSVCQCVHMHHVYICTNTHACMHTHTHTHTHMNNLFRCMHVFLYFVDKLQNDHVKVVTNTIVKLQDFVSTLTCLKLDTNEFAYLKTIVLFSPGKLLKNRDAY